MYEKAAKNWSKSPGKKRSNKKSLPEEPRGPKDRSKWGFILLDAVFNLSQKDSVSAIDDSSSRTEVQMYR